MEFWEIYDQYYAKVRRFILHVVRDEWIADDLIQETFLRIQRNVESLRLLEVVSLDLSHCL